MIGGVRRQDVGAGTKKTEGELLDVEREQTESKRDGK